MRFADQHVAAMATVLRLTIKLIFARLDNASLVSEFKEWREENVQLRCVIVMLLSATWSLLLILYFKFLKIKHRAHVVKFSSDRASLK